MEPTHTKNTTKRAHESKRPVSIDDKVENAETALRERVEQARDLVEDLRDRAEMAFHERPYLLPVATGALGFGVGVLVGSKLSRILFFTAAGALLSDTFRSQIAKVSRDFIKDLGERLEQDEREATDERGSASV